MGMEAANTQMSDYHSVQRFDLPDFDELTHRKLLPKSALRHGAYYIGRCRHACIARWNARQQ